MAEPTPILILGDSPELPTGLARIGRDLALLLTRNPKFRVGYYGFAGHGSMQLPFQQYQMGGSVEHHTWPLSLPSVWRDFSRGKPGILFTIWDLSRLTAISQPDNIPEGELRDFLLQRPFRLWGYFPLDATGPGGGLSSLLAYTARGFDRILTTSPWARQVFQSSGLDADWLPHGIDGNTWTPGGTRQNLIGVVATNQPRKDWGLAAAVCAELLRRDPSTRFWWHTDLDLRHWSMPALLADYGLEHAVNLTYSLTDHQMAEMYRACQLTLAIGLGEGFGYPIWESLGCGTPVIHGDYASGADLMRTCGFDLWLAEPQGWRLEGQHNCLRPVFTPEQIVDLVYTIGQADWITTCVEHLHWKNLKYPWMRWFEEGL